MIIYKLWILEYKMSVRTNKMLDQLFQFYR